MTAHLAIQAGPDSEELSPPLVLGRGGMGSAWDGARWDTRKGPLGAWQRTGRRHWAAVQRYRPHDMKQQWENGHDRMSFIGDYCYQTRPQTNLGLSDSGHSRSHAKQREYISVDTCII